MNYVISLKKTPERLEAFLADNSHLQFEVFEAVDGSALDLVGSYKHGGMGNAMSHIELWKKCIELNEPITICEDDALLHNDFETNSELFKRAIAYDFICWGWNYDADLWASHMPFLSPVQMKFNQDSMRANKNDYLNEPIRCILMHLHSYCGTICYTITPSGAQKFLDQCYPLKPSVEYIIPNVQGMRVTPAGLDSAMPEAYQNTASYVCFPPLALTDNDHLTSTVQND